MAGPGVALPPTPPSRRPDLFIASVIVQSNYRRDLNSGCLEATRQAQSTLIMQSVIVIAGVSAMSDI